MRFSILGLALLFLGPLTLGAPLAQKEPCEEEGKKPATSDGSSNGSTTGQPLNNTNSGSNGEVTPTTPTSPTTAGMPLCDGSSPGGPICYTCMPDGTRSGTYHQRADGCPPGTF